jgi:glutathione S-transferase
MGFVRTPPEKRDNAAIEAAVKECEALFAIMNNALANQTWFSGNAFGLGDVAIAPFVYNMLNSGLTWPTYPHLERWYQQLTELPSFQKVVMIPVT